MRSYDHVIVTRVLYNLCHLDWSVEVFAEEVSELSDILSLTGWHRALRSDVLRIKGSSAPNLPHSHMWGNPQPLDLKIHHFDSHFSLITAKETLLSMT